MNPFINLCVKCVFMSCWIMLDDVITVILKCYLDSDQKYLWDI